MSLYAVSVLHHDLVDYLVSVLADGRAIVIDRDEICTWYKTEIEAAGEFADYIYRVNVVTDGQETAKGVLLPLTTAVEIGAAVYDLPGFSITNILRQKTRGAQGMAAEDAFAAAVEIGCFAPTFEELVRKADEDEDRVDGIDFFVNGEAGTDVAVQVKYDGRAHQTGNIFVQTETAPVSHSWSSSTGTNQREFGF